MRGPPKSKRVSWAPDFNLCQVRLFLSEESPSQVGLGPQDHLQAKASWLSHPAVAAADDTLPPGFEGGHPTTLWQIKESEVPVIKWRCPPRFVLNLTWQVVAGEESQEVEVQNEREMRVLEAVYPRPSTIPQNPTFSGSIEDSKLADSQIPLVPITPIEDEDAADTLDLMGPLNPAMSTQVQPQTWTLGVPSHSNIPGFVNAPLNAKPVVQALLGVEPDAVAAANAAFSAVNKSNEHGSLIDQELLIKILNNPKLIEELVAGSGTSSNMQNVANMIAPFVPSTGSPPLPVTVSDPSHLYVSRIDSSSLPSLAAASSGTPYAQTNGIVLGISPNARLPPPVIPASSAPTIGSPQVKDVNYYKSLIQQHGGERQETPQHYGNRHDRQLGSNQEYVNSKSSKPKYMKPCAFFNSAGGCRNGANCAYQHDTSSQQRSGNISEVQSSKRMKMDREISS